MGATARSVLGSVVGVLLIVSVASAQGPWRRLDTPNFIVIGDVAAGDLKHVAIRFEGFRETLGRVLGPRVIATAVPTVVIVFSGDHAIAPFRPTYNGKPVDVAGLFVPGPDVNYIAIVDDRNRERERVVFHEFTHLATANSGQDLPVWLQEGLAEYYSTVEVYRNGREAILGGLIDSHLLELNHSSPLPLRELLTVDHNSPLYNEGNRRSVLYAQSWALIHMLLLGEPNRVPQLSGYLERVSRGVEPMTAWQEAFGALNIEQELTRYIQKRDFRGLKYQFTDAVAKLDAPVVSLPPADVQAFLADLLVQMQNHDAAAARLTQAASLEADNGRVRIGSARLALARDRVDAGGLQLRELPVPDDWFLAYMAGVTVADHVRRRGGRPDVADLDAGRRFLTMARSGAVEFPNAIARLADLELRSPAGPTAETAGALERARQRAPGRRDYAFLHAQVLARIAEYDKARAVLGPLMTPNNPPAIRDAARRLMGTIVDVELSRPPAATGVGGPPAAPPAGMNAGTGATSTSSTSTSTTTLPSARRATPVFRTVRPGEQRFEAVLERLECPPGNGITFHLTERGAAVTVVASALTDVDLITYRDDLTGSLGCGPLRSPMAVYVTWRPGPAGTRIAVAIEFLPSIATASAGHRVPRPASEMSSARSAVETRSSSSSRTRSR